MLDGRATIATAVLAALLSLSVEAQAAGPNVVSVVSPRDDGFVVERPGRPVTVKLRLSSGARVRKALVNGHSVSVAGVARGGRTRRLTVPGSRLRRGHNTVIVQARSASGKLTRHAVTRRPRS